MNQIDEGFRGNTKLKRKEVEIEWSHEQLQEYIKCMNDPIYFAEKYIKIVHVDHGLIPLELYDYQKDIIRAITDGRRVAVNTSRQAGKCVCINTPIRLRNKTTGEVIEMTIGEFYEQIKNKNADNQKKL